MDTTETAGSCLYAAIILGGVLAKFGGAHVKICGGGPTMDGGFMDSTGAMRGHYWVQGETRGGHAFVADITADQFRLEKIHVLPLELAAANYFPGDPEQVKGHIQEAMEDIGEVA